MPTTSDTPKIKVDLADGVSVELTQEQADAYKAAKQKAAADAAENLTKDAVEAAKSEQVAKDKPVLDAFQVQLDSLKVELGTLAESKAVTDAKVLALETENAGLKADADKREREDVVGHIKTACPKLDLTKVQARAGKTTVADGAPSIHDLKAAAVVDLNQSYAKAIEDYRGQPGFERFVDSLFNVEIAKAKPGAEPEHVQSRDRAPTSALKLDLNGMRNASLGQSASEHATN